MDDSDLPPAIILIHVRAPWLVRVQVAWDLLRLIVHLLNPLRAGAVMKSEWRIREDMEA